MDFLFAQEIPEVKDTKLNKEGKIIMPIGKIVKSIASAVKSNIRQRGIGKHRKTLREGQGRAKKDAYELVDSLNRLEDLEESASAVTSSKTRTTREKWRDEIPPEFKAMIRAKAKEMEAKGAAMSSAEKAALDRPSYFKHGVYGGGSAVKATARRRARAQATTKGKGYKAK